MSSKCAACKGEISGIHYMKCIKCNCVYDLTCLNITKYKFNKLSQAYKINWLCPTCTCSQPKGDNTHTPARPTTLHPDDNEMSNINIICGSTIKDANNEDHIFDISHLVSEIRQLRRDLSEMKQQNLEIKLLKQEVIELREQLSNLAGPLSDSRLSKIDATHIEITELKTTVSQLESQLNTQEQLAMINQIEIIGVPEHSNENLHHIVMVTSQKIGVPLNDIDIDDVTRIGPRKATNLKSLNNEDNKPRPIIVKFLRRQKRDEIIKAAKARRSLTSEDIVGGAPKKLYVNERLTKFNRLLFRDARLRAATHKFRYCWVRNGGIYVRENDSKPGMRISSAYDLDHKIGPDTCHST